MKTATEDTRRMAVKAHLEQGLSQETVARTFETSTRNLQRWIAKHRITGSYSPYPRGHRLSIFKGKLLKELEEIVEKEPDATLEEILKRTKVNTSIVVVHNSLKKLGYRFKKNSTCGGTRTR